MSAAHVIEAGAHYDTALFSSWPHLWQREFAKDVQFNEDCRYLTDAYNQYDVNKLFGASFGWHGVHWNSCRFGWYWDPADSKMVLVAYCYDKGLRNWDAHLEFAQVARVNLGQTYRCSIKVTSTDYIFQVTQGDETLGQIVTVPHGPLACWGWTLGLYFGGKQTPRVAMHVFID